MSFNNARVLTGHQDAGSAADRGQSQTAVAAAAARASFDVPGDVVYLNCANLAPRLRAVTAAGHAAIEKMASPWTITPADWFKDSARLGQLFASLIGAPPISVTLVPSVSYGIAVAARNLPVESGDNIVVAAREYPSNFYSWRRLALERGAELRTAASSPVASITDAIVSLIDRDTAIVAVSNCHWTDGSLVELPRIGLAARKFGAALVVDASQSLGALPLDVAECQPDFLVSVGYKWLLGPYGLAYLYVSERWHATGIPIEESWLHRSGSDNFATLADYTDAYKPGSERFGQGESSQFYLLPMAIAALSQIREWQPARIQAQLREWTDELAAQVRSVGFECPDPRSRAGHMIGLRAPNGVPPDLAPSLAARHVFVAVRGSSIRVSPHLHSPGSDIARLVSALGKLIT